MDMRDCDPVEGRHFLYKITNTVNGKCYIGVTANPAKRYKQHIQPSRTLDRITNKAAEKYGVENLSYIVIACGELDYISDLEVLAIDTYNTLSPNGYNLSIGGLVNSGFVWSSDAVKAISGVNHRLSSLSEDDVLFIRKSQDLTSSDIAVLFGITTQIVKRIRGGKSYKEIASLDGLAGVGYKAYEQPKGEGAHNSKLSESDVVSIIESVDRSIEWLAKEYYVSTGAIRKILSGATWSHLGLVTTPIKRVRAVSPYKGTTSISREDYLQIIAGSQMSSTEMSKHIGISRSNISRIRNGTINENTRFKGEY